MTDTKEKLMDVAEQLVRQKGADGFSYADLSEVVGIRKASIHYHFPAKSDLLTAIMARYGRTVMTALDALTEKNITASKQLAGFVDVYRKALQGGSTMCLCVAFAVSQEEFEDGTRDEILMFRQSVLAWLIKAFETAQQDGSVAVQCSPTQEASQFLAVVEGAQIAARIAGNPDVFDAACQASEARLTG